MGIEAKFDHELTRDQVDRQLSVVDQLLILLLTKDSAPGWVGDQKRVSVITWNETLECFKGSRLTVEDIDSMPRLKSAVEPRFRALHVDDRLPGWQVDIRRGGGGMPAIVIESPTLANGRTLRGQIQISGRGMPKPPNPVMIEYSIGVSVPANPDEYPDPTKGHLEPGWIEPLRTLHRNILDGHETSLMVSTQKPGNGRSELGKRKLPLAEKYLSEATWLAKGYTDGWALGIKSVNRPVDELEELTSTTIDIFLRWYANEVERLSALGNNYQERK